MSAVLLRRSAPPAPASYTEFVDTMRAFVESKGVSWEIPLDARGLPEADRDWDLRTLTDSHSRVASRTNGFAVDGPTRDAALVAGRNAADIPSAPVLDNHVQDFIKALIAYRCRLAQSPRNTRHCALIYRKFFSVTKKAPWDLNTEDFDRFLGLPHIDVKVFVTVGNLANIMSENMLSLHCPIEPDIPEDTTVRMQHSLGGRKDEHKLPDADALFELTRIVFQERPQYHQDLIRFSALRLMILTGLRLNEVLMLPSDCLRWEDHIDVVTGAPAGAVGGVSRSLRLRYFGEKHMEGAPDILVEERQWIPQRFQQHVVDAVSLALEATASLRAVLTAQHAAPEMFPASDLRRFKTNEGVVLTTADMLFLVLFGLKSLPSQLAQDAPVAVIAQSTVYQSLGIGSPKSTLFKRYSKTDEAAKMLVKPHSLRHLMNTELFRLNVPDTVITHQFGRQTVAQSYEYDHRTLAERLRFVQLPVAAAGAIKPGTTQELVAKMVVSGVAATSHVGQSFKRIQAEHGDEVAFQYLAANSDGFHVTPYGFCTNSFSVNPCARHLKCFDNCKHFAASGAKEHRVSLEQLRQKLVVMRDAASAKGPRTLGRKNQVAHANRLLDGVGKALEAQPRALVFPQGVDHSAPRKDLFQ
jgi:hypothetical protein